MYHGSGRIPPPRCLPMFTFSLSLSFPCCFPRWGYRTTLSILLGFVPVRQKKVAPPPFLTMREGRQWGSGSLFTALLLCMHGVLAAPSSSLVPHTATGICNTLDVTDWGYLSDVRGTGGELPYTTNLTAEMLHFDLPRTLQAEERMKAFLEYQAQMAVVDDVVALSLGGCVFILNGIGQSKINEQVGKRTASLSLSSGRQRWTWYRDQLTERFFKVCNTTELAARLRETWPLVDSRTGVPSPVLATYDAGHTLVTDGVHVLWDAVPSVPPQQGSVVSAFRIFDALTGKVVEVVVSHNDCQNGFLVAEKRLAMVCAGKLLLCSYSEATWSASSFASAIAVDDVTVSCEQLSNPDDPVMLATYSRGPGLVAWLQESGDLPMTIEAQRTLFLYHAMTHRRFEVPIDNSKTCVGERVVGLHPVGDHGFALELDVAICHPTVASVVGVNTRSLLVIRVNPMATAAFVLYPIDIGTPAVEIFSSASTGVPFRVTGTDGFDQLILCHDRRPVDRRMARGGSCGNHSILSLRIDQRYKEFPWCEYTKRFRGQTIIAPTPMAIDRAVLTTAPILDKDAYRSQSYSPANPPLIFPHFLRDSVDKDGDGVMDAYDRFPLDEYSTYDSDNDSIPDEVDIVTMTDDFDCVHSTTMNECASDLQILYPMWFFILIVVFLFSACCCHRKRSEDTFRKNDQEAIEDTLLLRREGAQTEVSNEELFKLLEHVDPQGSKMTLAGFFVVASDTFMLLLTFLTLAIAIVEVWDNKDPPSQYMLEVFTWVDFCSSCLFAVDLILRWVFREPGEYRNFFHFVRTNWYDFPSLITDIPGTATVAVLNFLVVTRLLRVFRLMRIFRVIRLYRRLTNTSTIILIMVNRPKQFLAFFVISLVVILSMALKITEQGEQDEFRPFENVVWFSVVSITTVGYGDLAPRTIPSRIIAALLMAFGIGCLGSLTATSGQALINAARKSRQNAMHQLTLKRSRLILFRQELLSSILHNPCVGVHRPFTLSETNPDIEDITRVTVNFSSQRIKRRFAAGKVQHDDDHQQSGGKFQAMSIHNDTGVNKVFVNAAKYVEYRRTLLAKLPDSRDQLTFILHSYKLHACPKVHFYRIMEARLIQVIFEWHKSIGPLGFYVQRGVSFDQALQHGFRLTAESDLSEPMELRLQGLAEILKDHGVCSCDFHTKLLSELEQLLLRTERVENFRMAYDLLEYRQGAKQVRAPVTEDAQFTQMPQIDSLRSHYVEDMTYDDPLSVGLWEVFAYLTGRKRAKFDRRAEAEGELDDLELSAHSPAVNVGSNIPGGHQPQRRPSFLERLRGATGRHRGGHKQMH